MMHNGKNHHKYEQNAGFKLIYINKCDKLYIFEK